MLSKMGGTRRCKIVKGLILIFQSILIMNMLQVPEKYLITATANNVLIKVR
jgi:hypothetical protein